MDWVYASQRASGAGGGSGPVGPVPVTTLWLEAAAPVQLGSRRAARTAATCGGKAFAVVAGWVWGVKAQGIEAGTCGCIRCKATAVLIYGCSLQLQLY